MCCPPIRHPINIPKLGKADRPMRLETNPALYMHLRQTIIFFTFFSGFISFSQEATETFSAPPTTIGHTIVDVSRPSALYYRDSLKNEKPIPISLWFPMEDNGGSKMTYWDYAKCISKERSSEENRDLYLRALNSFSQDSIPMQHFQALLDTQTHAVYTDSLPKTQYPLLLVLGGRPQYNLELAESIAIQGYIVASISRLGIENGQRMPFDANGSEEYQKDLEFVIDYLSTNKAVDAGNIHFVVWSFEGVPAFEYAKGNKNVKGFISLDSSLGYGYGRDLITDKAKFFEAPPNFPLIHFTGPSKDFGKDLSLLEALEKVSTNMEINKDYALSHGQFTSIASITCALVQSREMDPVYKSLMEDIFSLLGK